MARRLSYLNFEFAENEHPSTIKLNHFLSVLEKERLLNGPFSVSIVSASGYTNTASGIWLEVTDNIYDLGGVYVSGSTFYTTRMFDVEYQTQETTSGDYAIWEQIQFYESGGRYVTFIQDDASLYPSTLVLGTGASQINLSGATSAQFYCVRGSWT